MEENLNLKPSKEELQRRKDLLAYAKTFPQAKNVKRLPIGESTDYNNLIIKIKKR